MEPLENVDSTAEEIEEGQHIIDVYNSYPLAFQDRWHTETSCIDKTITQTWRMKERMKTVSVALVLCMNVGVDPPDVVKTTPCARQECWIDPLTFAPQKALEEVGNNLHKQYERWQPRARYKKSLDPTVDDIKRLCTSLRKNSKEERVLFHYNGHGVPRPTINGEIWVFNKTYTQYIPLSIYDLQTWMRTPSIYVYDCSNAGLIVNSFKNFALQRVKEMQENGLNVGSGDTFDARNCIQLAACGANQLLPMNPELPADLFTACLTTPIKIALQWFRHQHHGVLMPDVTLELIEKIPGRLNDRRTPLGELNWIFTAITDTIAWNMLPRDLFQKLFRQDLLVASLFRNFLLAERIMRSYHCNPISHPPLPPTFRHPMWQAWDHAVDTCLSQLPAMLEEQNYKFKYSPFFSQQLTSFQVWLSLGISDRKSPEQLPIVLQVLLSQVHRLRALDLLGKFLDLGPWAVSLALSVGIFPYVLKLLQSLAKELRPLLVFIWAKILAVDSACQSDLVKDDGHQYFLKVLQDNSMSAEHRTMAAFVLAEIVKGYLPGQEACLQNNIIPVCLDQLDDLSTSTPQLRQWIAICLGQVWLNYDVARWRGVRDRAHERLYELLDDPSPEVRAASVFALGTFIANQPEAGSDHAMTIDHGVGNALLKLPAVEGSPLVRCEVAVFLQKFVACYDSSICAIALTYFEEEHNLNNIDHKTDVKMSLFSTPSKSRLTASMSTVQLFSPSTPRNLYLSPAVTPVKGIKESSTSHTKKNFLNDLTLTVERLDKLLKISLSNIPKNAGIMYSSIYNNVWKALLLLSLDPHPEVSHLATSVVSNIMEKIAAFNTQQTAPKTPSTPSSPKHRRYSSTQSSNHSNSRDSLHGTMSPFKDAQLLPEALYNRERKVTPQTPQSLVSHSEIMPTCRLHERVVATDYCEWSVAVFTQPIATETLDIVAMAKDQKRKQRYQIQFDNRRNDIDDTIENYDPQCLCEQQLQLKNPRVPNCVKFNSLNKTLLVADKSDVSIWGWEKGVHKYAIHNDNSNNSSITTMQFINEYHQPLIVIGSDDGCIKVWKDCPEEENVSPTLVTAWKAVPEKVPLVRGVGVVTTWDQQRLQLFAAGDSRAIHIWDVELQKKTQELQTGADSCVTSLLLLQDSSLLTAGCGDGSLRMFDTRMRYQDCRVRSLRAHESWVVDTLPMKHDERHFITASEDGDIKMWNIHDTTPVHGHNISDKIRNIAVHPELSLIACGTANQSIMFCNHDGDELGTVKYYDGFLGQRIGFMTCIQFHPTMAHLAVGTADSFITIYSGDSTLQSP